MTTESPLGDERPLGADRRRSRLPFYIAVVLVGAWLAFLSVLALLSANPVTINREQILASDAVIVGVRDVERQDAERRIGNWVRVEQQLAGRGVPSRLSLPHFDDRADAQASEFVIPLRRTRDSFEITPAPEALDGRRLVYPASPETLEAVAKILATGDARPYP